jgi:hypothetical protein
MQKASITPLWIWCVFFQSVEIRPALFKNEAMLLPHFAGFSFCISFAKNEMQKLK